MKPKSNFSLKFILFLFLLLIYGFTFFQYLVKVDKYKENLNISSTIKNQLLELQIQFDKMNDLKTIREKAINILHMRYAKESEKMVLENEK
jgi:hypothetical protein